MRTLETVRKKLGLTQYGMAKRLGLTQTGYINAERNSKSVRLDILSKLRKIGGLTWDELGALIDREALTIEKARNKKHIDGL
jgi:transcriptional regulator with XRE-family HTH domain